MKTKHITSWRKHNDVLLEPMTVTELKDTVKSDGNLSAKLEFGLNTLIDADIEEINDAVSERITGSITGLTDIDYKVAGSTTDNGVIIKVTGHVEFEML